MPLIADVVVLVLVVAFLRRSSDYPLCFPTYSQVIKAEVHTEFLEACDTASIIPLVEELFR